MSPAEREGEREREREREIERETQGLAEGQMDGMGVEAGREGERERERETQGLAECQMDGGRWRQGGAERERERERETESDSVARDSQETHAREYAISVLETIRREGPQLKSGAFFPAEELSRGLFLSPSELERQKAYWSYFCCWLVWCCPTG